MVTLFCHSREDGNPSHRWSLLDPRLREDNRGGADSVFSYHSRENCEWESIFHKSKNKSFHSGFSDSIKFVFHFLFHFLRDFSLSNAPSMLSVIS